MSGTNNFLTQIRFSLRSLLLLTLARPRITLPGIAFPLLDVAALCLSLLIRCISTRGLPKPFRCISWHCPSLPLHINAAHLLARSRLTFSFHSVPMQCLSHASRPFTLPLPRRAIPCHSNASPLDTSPFPCRAGLFNAVPEPFKTLLYHCYPLLNYAFTSLGISFPPRCKPYLDDALPLRRVAKQRISMADRRISLLFRCL